MKLKLTIIAATLALLGLAGPLAAQPRKGAPGTSGMEGKPAPRGRAELEQRVRENFAAEVKKRLELTDDQMTKMMAVNQRLDAERRGLFQQERASRIALRAELQAGENANQARVSELLDTLLRLQRDRLELVEREQRELSAFLTPVQRARYQAFVDFMQRRMDDMSDGRGRGDATRAGALGQDVRRGDPSAPARGQGRGGKRPPPPQVAPPER